ncbi:MAG TPA: helix-turn-helix transcriptional regulator [Halanaerobiales bacterium]|nr:helix-turn-helix transcriptional regulator [Halanaerobiales bacterium]
MIKINLTERQKKIIEIVKNNNPITSKEIADKLDLTRGALRSDLSVLTMANILQAKPNVGYFYSSDNSYLRDFDELYGKKVKEIKSAPVVIREETSVYEAIVTLFLKDTGSLYVIDNKESLVGVVSRKDLLKISIGESEIREVPVSIIMTRMPNIVTISEEDTVFEAAKMLVENEVDSLPVIERLESENDDGFINGKTIKVIGKVSKTNVARIFVDFGLTI